MLTLAEIDPRIIIKKYGTGYYRASFLFPKEIREATWKYYQFVRIADELVDADQVYDKKNELDKLRNEWKKTQSFCKYF
jgi:phytoene/squalene synthetase